MKKALVIMNGTLVSQHIITASVAIAKFTKSSLHAFFLVHDDNNPQFDYLFPNDLSLTQNRLTGKSISQENAELVHAHRQIFIDECAKEGVTYTVEADNYISLKALIQQSVFADFILADAKANLDKYRLSDLLTDAHCPVLLLATAMEQLNKVVLAYDGSDSSMYAIKMFRYLFPEWSELSTHIIHVSDSSGSEVPFHKEFTTWVSGHYPNHSIKKMQGGISAELVRFINADKEHTIVVMGAFGRSNLSRMFHRSLAEEVIEKSGSPLFVVHE